MSYTITTTTGTTLATIADGTVNTTATSLTLIGKNYAGYGIFLNENFVKLLENFSNTSAPSPAIAGQIWYDTLNDILKVYTTGNVWKPISSSAASATPPVNAVLGDLWWDTVNSQLKTYGGVDWVTVGPAYTSTAGTSGAQVETILDSTTSSHVVVKFYISNLVVMIMSKDATFTPQTSIPGFTTIKPGLNLISSATLTGAQYTGDASNALSLNGIASNQLLRSDMDAATNYKLTAGSGALKGFGIGNDVTISSSGTALNITNLITNSDTDFYVESSVSGTVKALAIDGQTTAVTIAGPLNAQSTANVTANLTVSGFSRLQGITVISNALLPVSDNSIEMGSSGTKFANVWATTFRGTAITASYADLAERFEADAPMVPGTVVELGGTNEITTAVQELSENVFGVVSTLPGFLMNGAAGDDVTHPAVAVNGRVPVRVIGKVKKGDRLVSAGNGIARAAKRSELTAFNVLGRALENKETDDVGMVESIVKLNS